jgi:protein Xni
MPALRAAFEQRGIRCWASPGSEADDLAATLAVKVAQAGHQATIVSTDKGYCQLLSPTIRIRDYFQKRWLDAPFIASEFGVTPEQLADYWGLAGISSSEGTPSMLVGTCTPKVGSVTNSAFSMSPVRAAVTMARV